MKWLLRLLHLERVEIQIFDENRTRVLRFFFMWWVKR